MRQKNLVIGLLVMLALVVSGFTYAFWASGVTGNSDTAVGSIQIGEGEAVTTTVTVGNETFGGDLVPVGFEDEDSDPIKVSSVVLTFNVVWTQDSTGAEGTTGTLSVSVDSYDIVEYDEDLEEDVTTGLTTAQIDAMFDIDITSGDGASMTLGGNQNVVITVTFENEPATQAIYEMVAAGRLILNLTFTLGSIVTP
ncbi:MAG: hypothetical protein RG740_00430 [Acholeplasmataceae bacterium]|nr:hypothetical protein [Acholeplasmataceae bacterium]